MTQVKGAPRIKGLKFRRFKDKSDYAAMSVVSQKSWLADGFEWIQTEEDVAGVYKDSEDRDPVKDILIIETDRKIVGYGEATTERTEEDTLLLWNSVHLLPEWRGKGIREAVFEFNESELIRRARRADTRSQFQTWANDASNDWKSLVLTRGFKPSWHVLEMVRSNLNDIPVFDLPDGLEIRQVAPRDYRQLWEGMRDAYKQEPWFTEARFDETHFNQWKNSSDLSPELWQAAWEGERIVGIVQNFVKKEENEAFGRKRGHTERIFVVPGWQRKGVARALISRSLAVLRDIGMVDATLDVTAENVSGALDLYQSLGYKAVYHFTFYRKELPQRT